MRRVLCKVCIAVVGVALAASLAGCGADSPRASSSSSVAAPSPSVPPVDPSLAFEQYVKAARPIDCSSAYYELHEAYEDGDYVVMRDRAGVYRDEVAAFDAQLGKIDFPAAARPIVDRMRALNATELDGLHELAAGATGNDHTAIVTKQVYADDASVMVEADRLRAALGHPVPQAGYAADQLRAADRTFLKDTAEVRSRWEAANAANDLDGAKAASAIEIDALQRYIDQLGTIAWPPGYEDRVKTLRETLGELIEFDRRQVAVAAEVETAQEPEEGTPTLRDRRAALNELWDGLSQDYQEAEPSGKC